MVEIKQNKHVYAAYANMAQHNFFMVMGNIVKGLGHNYDPKVNSADIVNQDLNSKKEDVKMKAVELLSRGFPFLVPMADSVITGGKARNTLEAYKFLIPKIINVLNFYRNYTTHFDSDEDSEISALNLDERSLVPCMKDVFKAGLRTTQQRFGYEEKDMSFIKNKNMGKVDSKYSVFKKEILHPKGKPESIFSFRGLVFFISLFLEKKYTKEMLDKTKVFYTNADLQSTKRKSIIFESLSVYRTRLPRKRYDSEKDNVAFALDMINELQKCPKILFDILSREDQEMFRSIEKVEDDPESMLMMRHGDRFPQLAMKYIDMMEVFQRIRFQINLGKYRFAFYDKKCINAEDGEQQNYVRSLEKELHGFGRLHEIEQERRETWVHLIRDFDNVTPDTADTVPYITDHHASYMIRNNKVALYWKASREDPNLGLPQLITNSQSKDLRERKKNGEAIAVLATPKCFMSTHELVSLIFYHMLLSASGDNNKAKTPEAIIRNWHNSFKEFVKGVMSGEVTKASAKEYADNLGIKYPQSVPKKLVELIEGDTAKEDAKKEKLNQRLQDVITETDVLLQRIKDDMMAIEDKRNRRGTRKFVEIKPGRLGGWLAHDIVKMQPTPKNGNKITGLNFQILQSSLAIYDDFDKLKRILVGAHLILHEDAHPFLMDVINESPASTAEFYKRYLEHKRKWLRSIKNNDLSEYGFLTRGVDKWSKRDAEYYKRLLQRYLDMPVELPRGLFADGIKSILEQQLGKDFVKGDKRDEANTAFLISKYLKKVYQDENQEFYTQNENSYKRYYSFFKMLQKDPNSDYGKTVAQIDNFLRNDTSLNILSASQDKSEEAMVPKDAKEEVQKKLAKAMAKNPALNKETKIREIIANSMKLRSLTSSQQNALLRQSLGGAGNVSSGLVQEHIECFKSKEEQEKEKTFLANALRKMKETERQIRRIKVEDIMLFLMAREILFENDREMFTHRFDSFKLKNIQPIRSQDGVSALEIKVPFSITLKIKGSNIPVCIKQDSIKLKNYGDFMRFVYDSRLETLIPYLVDEDTAVRVDISREDLEEEFTKYDSERHEVFESVHKIEQLILLRHRELRDKSSGSYYYVDNGKDRAIRGNFSKMLEYAKVFTDNEGAEAVNIRNSFAHNAYKGEAFDKVKINTTKIGEIASALREKMEDKTTIMKKK